MSDNIVINVNKCMEAVRKNVGTVELEQFIYFIRSQSFDYTKWQRDHYDQINPVELKRALDEYSQNHTFEGEKAVVI